MGATTLIPAAVAGVGDLIIISGMVDMVTAVRDFRAGTPEAEAAPTVRSGYVVREVVTASGSRFFGHLPGGRYRGAEIFDIAPEGVSFE